VTISVAALHTKLTTQQAADFLGVSRPYLVKLLEQGSVPFRRLRKHRRVRLEDLLKFQAQETKSREAALNELAGLSQELGLYD
jgi:excisionase family DNA binding protein